MYKVFISYRREGGGDLARHIYERLDKVGVSTFFDIEEMRAGKFNKQLYKFIDECEKFVLVLPAHIAVHSTTVSSLMPRDILFSICVGSSMISSWNDDSTSHTPAKMWPLTRTRIGLSPMDSSSAA